MKRNRTIIFVSAAICTVVIVLCFIIVQYERKLSDKNLSADRISHSETAIDWPTVFFNDKYYQAADLSTNVVPEEITLAGTITTVTADKTLPEKAFETNISTYVGFAIYTTSQSDIIYLKSESEQYGEVYHRWNLAEKLKTQATDNWYPSVMVNDTLYTARFQMIDKIDTDLEYELIGEVIYEESTATINFSNSIGLLGADIYYSKKNPETIYVGYQEGPFTELYRKE